MAKRFEARLADLGGGINDSGDPSILGARFSKRLDNYVLYGPHAYRRNGIVRLTSEEHDERITGLFAFGETVGAWTLIVGCRSELCRLFGTVVEPLQNPDGVIIDPSDAIWRFRQYKGVGYAVRPGVRGLIRLNSNNFSLAGIDAPTAAPTVAVNATGVMEAGERQVVMTYFNINTDVESNPSPVSNTITLGDDDSIDVTGASISSEAQVTGRRFYVTVPGVEGQYYFALQVDNNNSTGPFNINTDIDNLGSLASFKNNVPEEVEYVDIEVWKERLWLTDGFVVKFSQNIDGIGQAEAFSPLAFLEIYPDDRNHVSAIRALGERLVVMKSNGVHAILASGALFEVQTISDRQGCSSGGSVCVSEGWLYWYSGENVYRTNGAAIEILSDPPGEQGSRIRTFLDSIPDKQKTKVEGAIHPKLGWYVLSTATGDSTTPTKSMIFDYRRGRWFGPFYHSTLGSPTVFGDVLDATEQPRIFAAFHGNNHVYDYIGTMETLDDDGEPIMTEWLSAGSDCGAQGYEHVVKFGSLFIDPVNATCDVYLLTDNHPVPRVVRMGIRLHSLRQVQRFSLPGIRAFHTQIGMRYSGKPRLVLKGAGLEADVFGFKEQPE